MRQPDIMNPREEIDYAREHEQRPRVWQLDCLFTDPPWVAPIKATAKAEFGYRIGQADIRDTLIETARADATAKHGTLKGLRLVGCPLPFLVSEVKP